MGWLMGSMLIRRFTIRRLSQDERAEESTYIYSEKDRKKHTKW